MLLFENYFFRQTCILT